MGRCPEVPFYGFYGWSPVTFICSEEEKTRCQVPNGECRPEMVRLTNSKGKTEVKKITEWVDSWIGVKE